MSANPKASADSDAARRAPAFRASLVLAGARDDGEDDARYAMFSASEITPSGAFLASSLLLELGEQITLEMSLDGESIRAQARVVGLDTGEVPGMRVEFSELRDNARQLIEQRVTSISQA